jgi:hypothetical protein
MNGSEQNQKKLSVNLDRTRKKKNILEVMWCVVAHFGIFSKIFRFFLYLIILKFKFLKILNQIPYFSSTKKFQL